MRVIDADALEEKAKQYSLGYYEADEWAVPLCEISEAPSIDTEPKRGRWKIEDAETIYGKAYLLTCSECGETVSVTETALPHEHFCRNCGADMRPKGADDE